MPSLLDLIQVIPPDGEEEPEDIFASAPGLIFPDDLRNMHGDATSTIVYKSQRFGDIELKTADPADKSERRLFAQYLWNAGLKLAELLSLEDDARWSVKGERVLELGAGVGLGGIAAVLTGADEVVISDYPAQALLDNVRQNAKRAITGHLQQKYHVQGYEWGDLTSDFAEHAAGRFTRILAADCFWMPYEHENIVRSMLHFLDPSPEARVFAVAGFHTGRAKLAGFFQEAESQGLAAVNIYEEDAEGCRREWSESKDEGREDVTERKKWLVIAILKRG